MLAYEVQVCDVEPDRARSAYRGKRKAATQNAATENVAFCPKQSHFHDGAKRHAARRAARSVHATLWGATSPRNVRHLRTRHIRLFLLLLWLTYSSSSLPYAARPERAETGAGAGACAGAGGPDSTSRRLFFLMKVTLTAGSSLLGKASKS